MVQRLEELRAGASLDGADYARGAAQVDAATEKMRRGQEQAAPAFEETQRKVGDTGRALGSLLRSIDPLYAAQQRLERGQQTLARALDNGRISADEQARRLAQLQSWYDAQVARAQRAASATDTMSAATASAAAELDALRTKYSPLFAAQQVYARQLSEIDRALEIGAISHAEYNAAMVRARDSYAAQTASAGAAATVTSRFGSAIQQAGFQVGDFAVQVASGGGVLRPLIQQGTQLISMFGPLGAVIGAAGAVVGALATSLLATGDASSTSARAADSYSIATERSGNVSEEAAGKVRDLTKAKQADAAVSAQVSRDALVAEQDRLARQIEVQRTLVDAYRKGAAGGGLAAFGSEARDAEKDLEALVKQFDANAERIDSLNSVLYLLRDTLAGVTAGNRTFASVQREVAAAIERATEAAEAERRAREEASARAQRLIADRDSYLASVDREIRQSAMLAAAHSRGARERAVVSKQIEIMNAQVLVGADAARQLAERIVDGTRALEREKVALELRNAELERATELADAETKARIAASDRARALIAERDTYLAGQEREIRQQGILTEAVGRGERAYRVAAQALQIMNGNALVGQAEATRLAERIVDAQDAFARVQASGQEVANLLGRAFERIGEAITQAFATGEISAIRFGDIARAVVSEVIQWFIRLSLINPLKNALMGGGTLPTIGGVAASAGGSALTSSLGSIFSPITSAISSGFSGIGTYLFGTAPGSAAAAGVGAKIGGLSNAGTPGLFGMYGGPSASSLFDLLGGTGLGFGVGSLFNSLIGGKSTGGMIGSGAGALIGTVLMPGLGSVLGGLLGGGLGGLFGPGKSVGPTGVARLPAVVGDSKIQLTTDNGGNSDAVEAVAKQIREASTAAAERLRAVGSRNFGLDVGGFEDGFTLKDIVDGALASQNFAKDLDAEAAVTEGVRRTLQKAFDGFAQSEVSTALAKSAADSIGELLADLDFANILGTFADGGIAAVKDLEKPLTDIEQAFKDLAKATAEGKDKAKELGLSVQVATDYFAALRTELVAQTQESFTRQLREARGEGVYNVIDDLLDTRGTNARSAAAAGLDVNANAGALFDAQLRGALAGASLADLNRVLTSGQVTDAGARAILQAMVNEQALASVREAAAQATEDQIAGLRDLTEETRRFAEAANDNARNLRQAADALLVNDTLSPLGPRARMEEAVRQRNAAWSLANDNTPLDEESQNAIQRLPALVQAADEAGLAYFGMTSGYLAEFTRGQEQLLSTAGTQEDVARSQLSKLVDIESQIIALGGIIDGATGDRYTLGAGGQYVSTGRGGLPAGLDLGYNAEQNILAWQSYGQAGVTWRGAGEGQINQDRAANPALDALLRARGLAEGGGWTASGPAGTDNLLYTMRLTAGEHVNVSTRDNMAGLLAELSALRAEVAALREDARQAAALNAAGHQQTAGAIRRGSDPEQVIAAEARLRDAA